MCAFDTHISIKGYLLTARSTVLTVVVVDIGHSDDDCADDVFLSEVDGPPRLSGSVHGTRP